MDCTKAEQCLSEYIESSLPSAELREIKEHLGKCSSCAALLDEMKSALSLCRAFPSLELEPELMESILLRTSGRPRTVSLGERIGRFFLQPLFVPRFAVGTGLALLFLFLVSNVMIPQFSGAFKSVSPYEAVRFMDQSARNICGKVLRAYEAKNEWEADFGRFRRNAWNGMRSIIEMMEEPMEGRKKQNDDRHKESKPEEESSSLPVWPA